MAGTWKALPSNCTRSLGLSLTRCAQWATSIRDACVQWATDTRQTCAQWADQGHSACDAWSDQGHNACCTWWPCSWACNAFYWVANWVCNAWYWVANWVCIAFTTIVTVVCVFFSFVIDVFCVAWNTVTFFLCLSRANGGTAFLLTDGSVLMQECVAGFGTRRWWKLTPDITGSYFNGTWSRVADSHVARKYFAAAVLADGRALVCGGEYTDASGMNAEDRSNRCEVYDPVANVWTEFNPPNDAGGTAWTEVGDASCALLSNGTFLMGNTFDNETAILDPAAMTWALAGNARMTTNEESWALMPDGTVINADCNGHPQSEKFVPATNTWMQEDNVPAGHDLVRDSTKEIGPAVLMPDGRAFFVGATGKTALFASGAAPNVRGTWTAGPDLPKSGTSEQGTEDGPGCLLVTGNVLIGIAPVGGSDFNAPTTFFEFDGTNVNRAADPPDSNHATFVGRMLLLPTGDVLYAREDASSFYAYTGYGVPQDQWRPVIDTCPNVIAAGATIQVSGKLFNGFSQAVGYGDDSTAATNYPLVRVKNRATGHVRYCRTSGHRSTDAAGNTVVSMGVATGARVITTDVMVPAGLEAGDSDLFVVANGIESKPFRVTVTRRGKG